MPISTDAANVLMNKVHCAKLGVDEFEYDFNAQFHEKPAIEVHDRHTQLFGKDFDVPRSFQRQFFRFVKDGVPYRFCIDPILKTTKGNFLFSTWEHTEYDWAAMDEKVVQLIKTQLIKMRG